MSDDAICESTGNVFADLGFADPATHRLKAELVRKLNNVLMARGLSQNAAAKRVGISQLDLSRLLSGRFRETSLERLLCIVRRIDC